MDTTIESEVGELEGDAEPQKPIVQKVDGEEGDPKPDELKTAIADLARQVGTMAEVRKEPVKPKELTQDEKDELYGVWKPEKTRPDYFEKFLRLPADMDPVEKKTVLDEFKGLFGELQTGLSKQAVTTAMKLFEDKMEKFQNEKFRPVADFVSQASAEKTRQSFYGKYKALDDPKYKPIVAAQSKLLADKDFNSDDEFFKALAESAAETIKGLVPDFDLGAGKDENENKKKPAGTSLSLPRGRVGGTGGAGGGQGKQSAGSSSTDDDINDLD